ncbi:preprotein translocase subunit YajC [Rhodococcus sp. D2-41]|uniref:Preprotein translocase subunit YajC n=1 Tax=Speluncibacter jeojiensis TaxID=2710754 RepID=A0A9X4RJ03_9ACTN|nr:preprotein translocase subunit YajC [Rhodococcus sp. D2-41]MDG3011347.1 preprotein translocase subunit YajC [Rhodococcus sp. D2-41]MDG3016641.1 preprotein translocase subunit YajC [Corynebacteriales bacterium D3-21]
MQFLFLIVLLVLVLPMFLTARRQKKAMAQTSEMQDALKVGDRVLLTSGLHGTVVGLGDTTVDVEIADDVVTTWERMAVRSVVTEDVEDGDTEFDEFDEFEDADVDDADGRDAADADAEGIDLAKRSSSD